ncbi:MAG: hypothetical protein KDJ82_05515 [Rhodobacteraceae bacterium]|nr:hypothetical protein [Paracoccaceae bacterium]
MLRKSVSAGIAALFLASAAQAQDTPVKLIDVTTDLTAIENPAAATYWTNLEPDLETAIAARLAPERLVGPDADGSEIHVDIDEIELASTWDNVTDMAESRLVGQVNITSESDNSKFDSYSLDVAFKDAMVFLPEGTDISTLTMDSAQYYSAMIEAFADNVVSRLK